LFILRIAAVALLGCGVAQAATPADPPGRVARINYSEGSVAYAPSGENEWTDADLNRPLVLGDKLWTDKGVRAEIQVGSSVVRMDGRTRLTVLALDDQAAQLSITQGSVFMRVRNLPEGENFEIDTPNLAYRAAYPGDYRIDVDPQRGVTRVTIVSGTGAVYGEKGQALPMGGGQQISFKGRALEKVNVQESPPQDNFDRWSAERNRRDDQSVAARYVPREVVGYQLLDAAGEWRQDANYGPVWFPQGVAATWAPYRNGRWEWIAPWGWTWLDDAPWAFITTHYGRWTLVGKRWAWAPGRMGLKPIYAPALVAFVGNGHTPLAIGGKQSVAWFPLAPGEAWQPAYPATPLYISSVNANMPPFKEGNYTYQREAGALTAISLDDFHRGRPSKGSWLHVAANALTNAQVVAPPSMPEFAKATAVAARAPAPATVPEIQQVANSGPSVQQQIEAQQRAQQQAQLEAQRQAEAQRARAAQLEEQRGRQAKAEQDRRMQEQKVAEQRRIAEQLRAAEQARRADQQKTAQEQQRLAEQTRRAEQQKQVEQQQRVAKQKADAARLAQLQQQQRNAAAARGAEAKRAAEQARREAVAKRAEQARREQVAQRAQAKKDEQARRVAHAQQVEQARRAADHDAQVLAQQRAEREAQQRKAEEKERAQREAWQKQQQAVAEQWKRDQQAWEEQQKAKAQPRGRPDLRKSTPAEPEVWQRSIPLLAPGRTS
jgi:hypothetical protein